jgi:hypothetical protein
MPIMINPAAQQRYNPARLVRIASFVMVGVLCVYTIRSHQSQANTTPAPPSPTAPAGPSGAVAVAQAPTNTAVSASPTAEGVATAGVEEEVEEGVEATADVAPAPQPTAPNALSRCRDMEEWGGYWVSQTRIPPSSTQSIEGRMVVRAAMPSEGSPKERVCMLVHGDIVRVTYEPHPPQMVDGSWWIHVDNEKYVTASPGTINISNTVSQLQLQVQQQKSRSIQHPLLPH